MSLYKNQGTISGWTLLEHSTVYKKNNYNKLHTGKLYLN